MLSRVEQGEEFKLHGSLEPHERTTQLLIRSPRRRQPQEFAAR
jgi:hypothetical protein